MERTWRWFGKKDKITLAMLRQIGVEGIVTALHDVPLGEVWTREKIRDLREYIESYGMRWSVVESLPVVETIKYGGPDRDHQIEVYHSRQKKVFTKFHCCIYCNLRGSIVHILVKEACGQTRDMHSTSRESQYPKYSCSIKMSIFL